MINVMPNPNSHKSEKGFAPVVLIIALTLVFGTGAVASQVNTTNNYPVPAVQAEVLGDEIDEEYRGEKQIVDELKEEEKRKEEKFKEEKKRVEEKLKKEKERRLEELKKKEEKLKIELERKKEL